MLIVRCTVKALGLLLAMAAWLSHDDCHAQGETQELPVFLEEDVLLRTAAEIESQQPFTDDETRLITIDGEAVEPPSLAQDPITLEVKKFEVLGSTVFDADVFQEALEPFLNRSLTFIELLQARDVVTNLYIEAGYVTSGAYLPPQDPSNATVVIQVIEGYISGFRISGYRRLNQQYVESRLALAAGPPLNIDELVDRLRLLQLNPLIDSISADLATGIEPGTSILSVEVVEADSFSVDLVTNNNRSSLVGSWDRGVTITEANLLGVGDGLSLTYLNTEGSNRLDVAYRVPVNARNGTLGFQFQYTDSEIIQAPFDILDINSERYKIDVSYRQPIRQTASEELALSLTLSRDTSETVFLGSILGEPIPFPGLGANERGQLRVTALRFGQEWIKRGSEDVVTARSQFSVGLEGANPAVQTRATPDASFLAWLGQLQWAHVIGPDARLVSRLETQLATAPLLPQEQIQLGGGETVRGYPQDFRSADNGILLSTEALFPVYRDANGEGLLQMGPFLDFGTLWNSGGNPLTGPTTLVGTGIGMQWSQGDQLRARLDWGVPLVSADFARNWQTYGLYFTLNLRLF